MSDPVGRPNFENIPTFISPGTLFNCQELQMQLWRKNGFNWEERKEAAEAIRAMSNRFSVLR